MPPSKASSAAYGPCRAAPGLLEAAGARRARDKKLTAGQAGLLRGVPGSGRSRASTAGGRDGREPQAVGRRRAGSWSGGQGPDPGPAASRPQPERGGVARVPGGRPARGEGASGPDAAPPSEGF